MHEQTEITEIVQQTYTAPSDGDNLVFNKDFYKANKEVIFAQASFIS